MSRTIKRDIALITGSGRSGTTWLADILNSSGQVCYKHEPFTPSKGTPYHAWAQDVMKGSESNRQLTDRFEKLILNGYIDIDRLPLKELKYPVLRPVWVQFYRAASRVPKLAPFYSNLTRVKADKPILIKDVWFPGSYLDQLVDVLGSKLISIVRNPFAVVSSAKRGKSLGVWGQNLNETKKKIELLYETNPSQNLAAYFSEINSVSFIELEAIRWRLEAELSAKSAQNSDRGHIVVYENLVEDTERTLTLLYDFLGWDFNDEVRAFVINSQSKPGFQARKKEEYFGTQRDAKKLLTAWKEHLTEVEVNQVDAIVSSSWLMKYWRSTVV